MIIIGRHINGVAINPREYLLDNVGKVRKFETEDAAKAFLTEKGYTEDDLDAIVFETVKYLKIGKYTPATDVAEAIIEREFCGQGYIFKDEEAYESGMDAVCYIPELSDTFYTHRDFLDMMDGQEELAWDLFSSVDWQHPEALVEEGYIYGEYDDCPKCGRMFASYDKIECPHCHAPYEKWMDKTDEGRESNHVETVL